MTDRVIVKSDWLSINTLCEEYRIDLNYLADLIEEKEIKTRGRSYDEIHQRDQSDPKLREIAHEYWSDGLIEESPEIFLYIYRDYSFGKDQRSIQSGYIDIEVSKKDFEQKATIKSVKRKRRIHDHIVAFKEIYDEFRNAEKWVSPDELLQHIIDEYDDANNDDRNEREFPRFNVVAYDENLHEPRKSILLYSIDGNPTRKITRGRLFNIISDFNNKTEA